MMSKTTCCDAGRLRQECQAFWAAPWLSASGCCPVAWLSLSAESVVLTGDPCTKGRQMTSASAMFSADKGLSVHVLYLEVVMESASLCFEQ